MKTTKPISTISFNSPGYLVTKLDELIASKIITFYAFIPHKPEDDEGGNKPHNHLYILPSKMIQTDDIRFELREFNPENPSKPFGVLPFRSSRFDSWYLYGLHDKRYLASKGESRRYHYEHSEFITSDDDELLCLSREIDLLSLSPYADMVDAIDNGLTWHQYFSRGTVPIPQVANFERAWNLLFDNRLDRGTHEPHPSSLDVDEETGELR